MAVAAVGECLNYLFDESNTTPRLNKLFGRIYAALRPGGMFLFDVAEPGRVPGGGPHRSWWAADDWAVLVSSEEDRRHQVLTRRITSFRRAGELYQRDQEVHQQQLFKRSELARRLRGIGFRVRILRSYGPLRLGPGHAGLMVRRP